MKRTVAVVVALSVTGVAGTLSSCTGENAASTLQRVTEKGGDERTGEYNAVPGWWKPASDHDETWTWGAIGGVAVDTPDRIIIAAWGDRAFPGGAASFERRPVSSNFLVAVDGDGNITENWAQWDSILNTPHQIYISPYDPERHIWVSERGGNGVHEQILKFSNDGSRLVMQLRDPNPVGTREEARANSNPGPLDFGANASLAFLPDGSFLLADGYWNSRIVKYTADGEYVMEWGEFGTGPGQFDLVHGVDVDRNGRVYVADRGNSRIQVFTSNGEYIEEWPDVFFPVDISIDENDAVWVVSALLNKIMKYNTNGELQYTWGTYGFTGPVFSPAGVADGFGPSGSPEEWREAIGISESAKTPGGMNRPHQLDVDQDGNLYLVNWTSGHVDKFVPKPNADPSKLVGRSLGYPSSN